MIGVYPVRNSSPAIAGLETEQGIISNGVNDDASVWMIPSVGDEILTILWPAFGREGKGW